THGRTLMKIMGEYYRQYFSSTGLIDGANCRDANRIYFWADVDQRTLETARALRESMLPGCNAEVHSGPPGKPDPLFDPIEAGVVKPNPAVALAAVSGRVGPNLNVLIDANRSAFDKLNHILVGSGQARTSLMGRPVALTTDENAVTMSGPLRTASTLTENLLL